MRQLLVCRSHKLECHDWPTRLHKPGSETFVIGRSFAETTQAPPRKVLLIRGWLAILFPKLLLLVALERCCSSQVKLNMI